MVNFCENVVLVERLWLVMDEEVFDWKVIPPTVMDD